MTTNDKCVTCGNTRGWHEINVTRHPFNDGSLSATQVLGKKRKKDQVETKAVDGWPFDPVLRMALIDKGVLTPDDLRAAEEKIRATTNQTVGRGEGAYQTATGDLGGPYG